MSDETELKPNRITYTSPTQIRLLAHYYVNGAGDPFYCDTVIAEATALTRLIDTGLITFDGGIGKPRLKITDHGRDFFERILALNPVDR